MDQPDAATETAPVSASRHAGLDSPLTRDSQESTTESASPDTVAAARGNAIPAPQSAVPAQQPTISSKKDAQYHRPAAQYHLRSTAVEFANENADPDVAKTGRKATPVHPPIARRICGNIGCDHWDEGALHSDPAEATDPLDKAPVSSVLGAIEDSAGCGNTNISVRISSPGDDGPVSQVAPAGDCGRNSNISIRINSPGDNGPVSQTVRVATPSDWLNGLPTDRWRTRPLLDSAGTGSGAPAIGGDPTTLPAEIDRSARDLAASLVSGMRGKTRRQPQRKAPAPSTSKAGTRGGTPSPSTRPIVPSRAASVTVPAARQTHRDAEAPVHRAHRRARAATRADTRRLPRLAHAPTDRSESIRGTGWSSFPAEAMLIAFLAALAVSYLLVPPLGRGAVSSLFGTSDRGRFRR
jgi:hypothetical protein